MRMNFWADPKVKSARRTEKILIAFFFFLIVVKLYRT